MTTMASRNGFHNCHHCITGTRKLFVGKVDNEICYQNLPTSLNLTFSFKKHRFPYCDGFPWWPSRGNFFLNLRTSPTISIIIAAFNVYLNDVIATFYGFSGLFYRNASRCLKIRFWIDFGRLTDLTSFIWKEILIWLNRDSLHYFTAECSRG